MKWELIFLVLLFLVIFFIIATSFLFYLRHWSSRPVSSNASAEIEGIYFKRYIPEILRDVYDHKRAASVEKHFIKNRPIWARVISVIILITAVTAAVFSLVENAEQMLLPIELEPGEIEALDMTQHQWRRAIDQQVPELSVVMANMKVHGLIVPFSDKDEGWLLNDVNIREVALAHWEYLVNQYNFNIIKCNWKLLSQCQASHPGWTILVLPGYWNFESMDSALNRAANILIYGPPAQIFKKTEHNAVMWGGLTFETVLKSEGGAIILRGDQLLTLGFDAGQIISAYSAFNGFRASSKSPQAVSIGAIYDAGGGADTRVFAGTIGKGRFVWMDFAPDPNDQSPATNLKHLNGLVASIFRFLTRQSYSAIATWPNAKQFAALIEEDTEDKFSNAEDVIELVKRKRYPISWFILSNEALKERTLTREMSAVGEIACHGDNHGAFTKSSPQEQVIRIARCQKVLAEITGVKPIAFRPPEEEYNTATINAVANNGMTHFIANNSPNRAVPELLVTDKNNKVLVSIPRVVSDDFEMWYTRKLGLDETLKLIDEEINWMSRIGGIYMYSFHTQYMGGQNHVDAIEYMGDKLQKLNVFFSTSMEVAEWWRYRAALQLKLQQLKSPGKRGENPGYIELDGKTEQQLLARFQPVLLHVGKDGGLKQAPYR